MEFKIRIKNQKEEDNKYLDCCYIDYDGGFKSLDRAINVLNSIEDDSELIRIRPYIKTGKVIAIKKSELLMITKADKRKFKKEFIEDYKDAVDLFIEERLIITNDKKDAIKQNILYQWFIDYCTYHGEPIDVSNREFYERLSAYKIPKVRRSDGNYRKGIKLKGD